MDELSGSWLPIVKEADPEQFIDALDPSNGGQKGRMLLDEAMRISVDCMRCKPSMCCIACALDLRCCKVRHRGFGSSGRRAALLSMEW